jgi:hypothetical protein
MRDSRFNDRKENIKLRAGGYRLENGVFKLVTPESSARSFTKRRPQFVYGKGAGISLSRPYSADSGISR